MINLFAYFAVIMLAALQITSTSLARPVAVGVLPAVSPLPVRESAFEADVCRLIDTRSKWRGINPHFITRLIHTESRFRPDAVSPAGAEGIAQFIPSTARMRKLENPFDPASALVASIDYLAELQFKLGNLGLAAVAYNAGEGAAARFISGGGIPYETENFVLVITGRPADDWREGSNKHDIPPVNKAKNFQKACLAFVKKPTRINITSGASRQPWGVQISEHFSRGIAVRMYNRVKSRFPADFKDREPMLVRVRNRSIGRRLRHAARIGADSRSEAMQICSQLRARSTPCLVLKTR